jgi:AGZA family xanthine/uracil permease-like MFS transporter
MGVVVSDPLTGTTAGDLGSTKVVLAMFGLLFMTFLEMEKFKAALLIPIVSVCLSCWFAGLEPWPSGVLAVPSFGGPFLDFSLLGSDIWMPFWPST